MHLIVTRTHLPISDQVALSAELKASQHDVRLLLAKRKAAGQDVTLLEPLVNAAYAAAAREMRRRNTRVAFSLALLVPILVLAVLGVRAQATQSTYFATLPSLLRHQTSLYHNTLLQPDSAWPTHSAATGEAFGAAFTPRGYQLHGDATERYIAAQGPGTYGNAAIAVTITPQNNSNAEVGLALRAHADGSSALVFAVNGYWWYLWKCDLHKTNFDDGCSLSLSSAFNVIQRGGSGGGTYTMMAVMHGDSFLFYVNDHLYGIYNDTARLFADSGGFGFYSSNAAQPVTFTDLAIYPAGGATPWDYI